MDEPAGIRSGDNGWSKEVLRIEDLIGAAHGDDRRQVHADGAGVRPVEDGDVATARLILIGANEDLNSGRRGVGGIVSIAGIEIAGAVGVIERVAGNVRNRAVGDVEALAAGEVVVDHSGGRATGGIADIVFA